MDDEERRRIYAEMDRQIAANTTPQPRRIRISTGRLFHVADLAVARICAALGINAMPEEAAKEVRRILAEAEERCAERHEEKIAKLETQVNDQRAELERQRREFGEKSYAWDNERRDLVTLVKDLQAGPRRRKTDQ